MSRAEDPVEASIRAIREAVDLGRRLGKRVAESGRRDREYMTRLGAEVGLPAWSVEKRRRLADPRRGYTDDELERLFALMRQKDRAVGLTFLEVVATVPRATRRVLLRVAVVEGWSLKRLIRQVSTTTGRGFAGGGRRPHVPEDASGLLLSLHAQCTAWTNWMDEVRRDVDRDGQPRTSPVETLKASGAKVGRRGIVAVVGEIEERVRELRAAIEGLQEAGRKK